MKDPTTAHRHPGWRDAAAALAVVAALAGCGTDAPNDDTLLPTPPPATDPLDPSE